MRLSGGVTCWTFCLFWKGSRAKWEKRRTCSQSEVATEVCEISYRKALLQMFFSERSLQSEVATDLYIKKCEERNVRNVFELKQQPNFLQSWLMESVFSNVAFFGCSTPTKIFESIKRISFVFSIQRLESKRKPRIFRKSKARKRCYQSTRKRIPYFFSEMYSLPP